jgi:hypothetical protein
MRIRCVLLGLLAVSVPSVSIAAGELTRLLELPLVRFVLTRTEPGIGIARQVLGRPATKAADLRELAQRLELAEWRPYRTDFEARFSRLELRFGEIDLDDIAKGLARLAEEELAGGLAARAGSIEFVSWQPVFGTRVGQLRFLEIREISRAVKGYAAVRDPAVLLARVEDFTRSCRQLRQLVIEGQWRGELVEGSLARQELAQAVGDLERFVVAWGDALPRGAAPTARELGLLRAAWRDLDLSARDLLGRPARRVR